jgi:hypothetical protein
MERDRTDTIAEEPWITLPADANLESLELTEPITPFFNKSRIGKNVGHLRWDGLDGRLENAWQGQERGVDIECRKLVAASDALIDARAASQQSKELWLALHQDRSCKGLHDRRIANELNRVAETLLGVKQNGFPWQWRPVPQ